jgi:DNA-binding CsgD family transcriptional regulator/MFS family permease
MGMMRTGAGNSSNVTLVGIGFWQAWWMCTSSTDAVIGPGAFGASAIRLLLATTLAGYIVCLVFSGKLAPYSLRKGAIPLVIASGIVGTLALAIATHIMAADALGCVLLAIGLALVSVSGALLLIMWGERWSTLAAGSVGRQLVSSFVAAFVIYLLMPVVPWKLGSVLCALFLAASAGALVVSWREPQRAEPVVEVELHAGPVAATLASLFVISAAFGTWIASPCSAENRYGEMLAAGAFMLVFALFMIGTHRADDPFSFYRPIIPAIACGMIFGIEVPAFMEFLGGGAVVFGIYCMDMFVMFAACDLAFRAQKKTAAVFGAAIVAMRSGTLFGRELMVRMPQGDSEQVLLLVMLGLVILAGTTTFTEYRLRKAYLPGFDASSLPSIDVDTRCDAFASRAGLTPREREIMRLLARNCTNAAIAEELGIAQGTVKHHTSNIYRKLGVYDRQGLIDLVQRGNLPQESQP